MIFYCKKCQNEFDTNYEKLFDNIKCPNCNKIDIVLSFIKQGILPPQDGYGLALWEFEDVLENGKERYLIDFFEQEFNLKFVRKGEEIEITDAKKKKVNLEELFKKTQEDGKLQRMIYNIHYVMLLGD